MIAVRHLEGITGERPQMAGGWDGGGMEDHGPVSERMTGTG